MSDRIVRAVPTFILGLAAMGLVAYALGRLTHSDWVWWLAPLTVAVEGLRLLRVGDGAALLSPSNESIGAESDAFLYVASYGIATAMAAGGAYAGNRPALLTGTALALIGNALEWARTEQSSNLGGVLQVRIVKFGRVMRRRMLCGCGALLIACSTRTRHHTDRAVDFLGVEQARFAAMTRADVGALDTLLAEDLIYTHTTGRVETKDQFLTSLRDRHIVYERINPADRQVRRPAPDVAVITGRARVWVTLADTRQEFDIRFTDVLVRSGSRWQTAIWQSTRLPPAGGASGTTRPPQN